MENAVEKPYVPVKTKLKYVEIKEIEGSQFPFRLFKKRTGQLLGTYETREKLMGHLDTMDADYLASRPASRKVRG